MLARDKRETPQHQQVPEGHPTHRHPSGNPRAPHMYPSGDPRAPHEHHTGNPRTSHGQATASHGHPKGTSPLRGPATPLCDRPTHSAYSPTPSYHSTAPLMRSHRLFQSQVHPLGHVALVRAINLALWFVISAVNWAEVGSRLAT
jgi:hypothetical protein